MGRYLGIDIGGTEIKYGIFTTGNGSYRGKSFEYRRQSGEQKCLADRYVCIVYSFGDMGIFYVLYWSKSSLGT